MSNLIPNKDEILNELLRALVQGIDIEEISKILYEYLKTVMPLDRLGIVFISEDGKYFESRVNLAEYPVKLIKGFQAKITNSTLKDLMKTGDPRIINDLKVYLEKKPESVSTRLMVMEGIQSNMSVPLIANGHPIGVLFLAARDKGAYGQGHVEIVNHIVPAVSITLEKAQLLQNLQNNQRNLVEAIAEKEGLEHQLKRETSTTFPWDRSWREWEKHILVNVLHNCRGRIYGKNGAAAVLQLPPTTLQGKLKKLGLSRKNIMAAPADGGDAY